MTGRSKLNELGGLYKYMPLTLIFYVVGGISISGFPLFSGFVSKSMIVAGAGEAHHTILMVLLLLASVGTFLSVGLKLPYFAWFGKDCGLTAQGTAQEYALGHGVDFPPLPDYRRLSPGAL